LSFSSSHSLSLITLSSLFFSSSRSLCPSFASRSLSRACLRALYFSSSLTLALALSSNSDSPSDASLPPPSAGAHVASCGRAAGVTNGVLCTRRFAQVCEQICVQRDLSVIHVRIRNPRGPHQIWCKFTVARMCMHVMCDTKSHTYIRAHGL